MLIIFALMVFFKLITVFVVLYVFMVLLAQAYAIMFTVAFRLDIDCSIYPRYLLLEETEEQRKKLLKWLS